MELTDNPRNETAGDLVKLVVAVRDSIDVQLCVLPITVDEAQRTLRDVVFKLANVRPGPRIAAAANDFGTTGLVGAYLTAASKSGSNHLTPQEFFGPYEDNLVSVLAASGIRLLNTDLDKLRVAQDVVDDVLALEEDQKAHRQKGPKPYESNLHDMVLWHYAKSRRPAIVESPADAQVWVCTLDHQLIAFDRRKRQGRRTPPICLTPSSLIQLIQFWAPRSPEMDIALVGSMREPLLFLDFDIGTERATIDILGALSRFENIDDFSTATVMKILSNDALRTKLERSDLDQIQTFELVRDAVAEEAAELERQLESERERAKILDARSARELEEKEALAREFEELSARSDSTMADLQKEVARLATEHQVLFDAKAAEVEVLKRQKD